MMKIILNRIWHVIPPSETRDRNTIIRHTVSTTILFINVSDPEIHIYKKIQTVLPTVI